ncbi:MAG: NAD(P)/FAD-dependent oxidoreductase [Burkholderiales bacterium]
MSTSRYRVIVIGGGFGGRWTTRGLASAPVSITLIDQSNHHLFQPLLYQVATAGLSAPDISAPLRHILRKQSNVEVRLGKVVGIDVSAKQVTTEDGAALAYDTLVVATGATHAYFGNNTWAPHAPGLKTLNDALHIRQRILFAFEQAELATSEEMRNEWMHFAIVGGGPTGVELAGTLSEIARHTLRNEFRHIDPHQATVRLIEAGPRVLASFPESLSQAAHKHLVELGVDVRCGAPVTAIDDRGYELAGERVNCRTILWAAGVAASPLGAMLPAERDRAGRVCVEADLTIKGHPDVYVIGDLASVQQHGKPVPGVAPAAKQMGAYVADRIKARLTSTGAATGAPKPFHYVDYGNLATIGRMAAVVDLRGFRFSGLLAWWFWLAAHVFFLIGFRNRLAVLLNWAISYWTYQRSARIMLDREDDAR